MEYSLSLVIPEPSPRDNAGLDRHAPGSGPPIYPGSLQQATTYAILVPERQRRGKFLESASLETGNSCDHSIVSARRVTAAMQRNILAYDANCASCSKVSTHVAGHDRLEVKGLDDREVRKLLDEASLEWRFQPTLISVDGDRVETFTGPLMAARLVMLVGPRRAAKVVKALGEEASSDGATRRTVLGRGILMTGAVLFGGVQPLIQQMRETQSMWSMLHWSTKSSVTQQLTRHQNSRSGETGDVLAGTPEHLCPRTSGASLLFGR